MIVYGLWHGGSSYSYPSIPGDVERFDSIRAAGDALQDRAACGHWQSQAFRYINRPEVSTLTPVAHDATMTLYAADPSDDLDPYPFRILELTAAGNVRTVTT